MHATYNISLVILSIVVAMVVSYTALKLAGRVAAAERSGGGLWLLGGAAAMGIGIWSMHFIGMLAFSVDVPLRYNIPTTLVSLAIAIITSGFALAIASRRELTLRGLAAGAVVMGAGICAMHYSGMAAIQITPSITYDPLLVFASIAIAITASFAALWLAFRLRTGQSWLIKFARAGAAMVMGLAISGMHYTAMAACRLSAGAHSEGRTGFDNDWLAVTIGIIALGVLAIALVTVVFDAHLESQTRRDALRLAEMNADLQHGKSLLALATRAAGIASWEFDVAARTTVWTENEIESLRKAGVDTRNCPDAIMEMIHPDDASIVLDSLSKAVAEGRDVCALRIRLLTPAGDTIHLQAHARIFCDEAGKLARLLGVSWDVTEQVRQEDRERELQSQLRDLSRHSGMAEVATGVLHSVGNVLNSLGVSASLVQSGLRDSRAGNVQRIAKLLVDQGNEAGRFLETDERGRQIPAYLAQLGENLTAENSTLQAEARAIGKHVDHIRKIVAAQQTYARRGSIVEAVDIDELIDNAVALNFGKDTDVEIKRQYDRVAPVTLDRHKVIQIMGNLLSNARDALKDQTKDRRLVTLRIHEHAAQWLVIEIEDSGMGIEESALKRLFEFGFTTKTDGHGFGLHTSAILAKELGGDLTGHSSGAGHGAKFTLRLPLTAIREVAERKRA